MIARTWLAKPCPEIDGLLKSRNIFHKACDIGDFEPDVETLKLLGARGLIRKS